MNNEEVERHLASMGYEPPETLSRNNDNPYCTYNENGDTPYEYKPINKYVQYEKNICIECLDSQYKEAVSFVNNVYTCGAGHRWRYNEEYGHEYIREKNQNKSKEKIQFSSGWAK